MLKPGSKVKLTYYEGQNQAEAYGWVVEEYDNGLLKVFRPEGKEVRIKWWNGKETTVPKAEATKPVIFNLRSIGFLKVEIVE